jgi:acyl-CoA thioester hydrolase
MAHEHRLVVRYGETDQMGVAHHANYLLYMEEARTAYMQALGCPYHELERTGIGLPVRRVELRYRAPARFGDELAVDVWIGRVGAASVRFEYRLRQAGAEAELATGSVELACVDLAPGALAPRVLPDSLRALLERA